MRTGKLSGIVISLSLAGSPVLAGDRLFVVSVRTIDRYELPSASPTAIATATTSLPGGACSADGYIYFSNDLAKQIELWDQDGGNHAVVAMPELVPGGGIGATPTGLAFDPAGDLYINTHDPGLFAGAGGWRLKDGDPAGVPEQVFLPFALRGRDAESIAGGPHAGAILLTADDHVVISISATSR